jgi:hypothetical protein
VGREGGSISPFVVVAHTATWPSGMSLSTLDRMDGGRRSLLLELASDSHSSDLCVTL